MITIGDKKLDKSNLKKAADVLCNAFKNDPLYLAVFQNEKDLCRYIKLMVDYYNRNGEIHVAVAEDEIVGVSIWNHKGRPFFSIRSALASGMFKELIKFLMLAQIKSLIMVKNEALITERYHYNKEHHYLFMIASVRKGAGRALMEYDIKKFSDCPIYLENSNIKDNQKFYERLGFHSIKTIDVMGTPVDLLTNSKGDQ
ncbi:GNAT family N-acetyltransferase [uncultured Acetobacterium sp.]|uniref:GNAT family N-acetyltransferase n=1 Tax=uncultured Acetobacterium sp. TaxID=217139 RepID=UPI0025D0EF89|nr:GNAT family N-acetyltransferase [uncultured Acetobacterium sp.]